MSAGEIDDACVAAAANGCEESLSRVLKHLLARSHQLVGPRLGDAGQEAVDEVGHMACSALSLNISNLQNRTTSGLYGYYSGIVRHKVREHLQSARPVQRRDGAGWSDPAMLDIIASSDTTPKSAHERSEQVAHIRAVLSRAPAADREIIQMAIFDRLKTGQIAEELQISRRAASMRLIRALKRLRDSFSDDSGVYSLGNPS